MLCRLKDGTTKEIPFKAETKDNVVKVTIDKNIDFSGVSEIDFNFENNIALSGDDGYLVLPNTMENGGMLCYFNDREDTEYKTTLYTMPIFGVKRAEKSFLAIVTGYVYDYTLVAGVKDGKYYVFPRFELDGEQLYEDITVEYHYIDNADYNAMAREYRKFKLEHGDCIPLKERVKNNPILDKAVKSPLIRIRHGWKPMPTQVLHQTIENEPEMHVACTFKTAQKLVETMKSSGIDEAEIQLVGWNQKGHDGRWPAAFPVEEALGGEEDLKELIERAKELGYLISCHTNSTDAYEISSKWNEEDLLIDKSGNRMVIGHWSGGEAYALCPKVAKEQAEELLPEVKKLGFEGLHYVDVLNIVQPRSCYNEKHPINRKQAIEYNNSISKLSRELFGGYSSEGVLDFAAPYLDYGLYVSFMEEAQSSLCDKTIPLWQLVYHGIIMSNPCASTLNYPIREEKSHLKVLEHGGRPSMYVYYKFVDEKWMASTDLTCDNDEDMMRTVGHLKSVYDEWKEIFYLQTEFMEEHREISENVFEIRYSDGSVITVDYNNNSYNLKKPN